MSASAKKDNTKQDDAIGDITSNRGTKRQRQVAADADLGPSALKPVCRSWVRGFCPPGSAQKNKSELQALPCPRGLRHCFENADEEARVKQRVLEHGAEAAANAQRMNRRTDDPYERAGRGKASGAGGSAVDVIEGGNDTHSGAKGSKSKSDRLFVQWLLEEFDEDSLRKGTGILDVAGGKGEVSFELHCRHGIHSTLIDPRPYKLRKYQRKMIRRSLEQVQLEAGGQGNAATWVEGSENKSQKPKRQGAARGVGCFKHIQAMFDDGLMSSHTRDGSRLFADCSMIVGMHPGRASGSVGSG
jgi:hypothetical protein